MLKDVEQLVEALRIELQHYGELLALLEAETPANPRGLPAVLSTIDAVRRQGAALQDARTRRCQLQARVAWPESVTTDCASASAPASPPAAARLVTVPLEYQPLLQALSAEVADLAVQVQERAVANCSRLGAAAHQLEGLIHSINTTPANDPVLNA
jgi:hypothetical protein